MPTEDTDEDDEALSLAIEASRREYEATVAKDAFETALDDTQCQIAEELDKASLAAVAEREVDDATLCVVCLERRRSHVAIPCGHLALCGTCAARLTACPCCRSAGQFVRVHNP